MKENKQPILSICIPTYNRKKFLEENLNKILAQLNNNELLNSVEIVISDNDSKDGTWNLVKNIWSNNIKYFKNDYNIWWLANIMKVAEYPSWEYLWLLADDDCITDFAIEYVLDIIKAENFDVMFCNSLSSEDMDVKVEIKKNEYEVFDWIADYLYYLRNNYKWYKNLISFFSFYSILIAKTEYFREWVLKFQADIDWNDFPHDIVLYHDLLEKKIIIPDNIFVIWRLLNEWYVWSVRLIKTFNQCMNFIESQNKLDGNLDWNYLKKICKSWWTKNLILWLIISKLHINYKTNKFFKKIYYFYKKWIQ